MPAAKKKPTACGIVRVAMALALACGLALPAFAFADTTAGGTQLGIRITDSSKNQGASTEGTLLGIRVTNSAKPAPVKVTWNPTGGAWSDGSTTDKTTEIPYGQATTEPDAPVKVGYTFKGWSTAADGVAVDLPTSTFASTTWYAVWQANAYAVSLDRRGGTGGTAQVTAVFGSALPAISIPVKTGYAFGGYYDAVNEGKRYYNERGQGEVVWDRTAETTLYAHWTAKKFTLSFDANGGTGGQSEQVHAVYDAAMPAISASPPTREGYAFAGWFDAKTGGTQYYTVAGESACFWDKDADATLYAQWILLIDCKVPTSAVVAIDASGAVSVARHSFTSSTAEDITVASVISTPLLGASAAFVNEATRDHVKVTLIPPESAGSKVEVPLSTASSGVAAGFVIPKLSTLEVAFGLSLPQGAQLAYAAEAQEIAQLSYVVEAVSS